MVLTPQDVAQRAADTAKGLLGAAAGVGAKVAGAAIAGPDLTGPIPDIGKSIARAACRRYADSPDGMPGAVAAGMEAVCRPYLDDIGYGTGPGVKLPYRGGQCQGVSYLGDFNWTADNGTSETREFPFEGGALQGVYVGDRQFNFTYPIGVVRLIGGTPMQLNFASVSNPNGGNPFISNIRRQDGQLDNCGNPPVIVVPPGLPTVPPVTGPERYNPDPSIDVDIDVDILPNGTINVNIGTGPITIDPFGGSGGGSSGGPGGDEPGTSPVSGLPPGDIGQAAEPIATGPGGVAAGCAPPNSVLVGLRVNILEPLPDVSQYDDQVWRGVCYVYMGVPGNLALDPSGVALRNGQFCLAPLDNLTCWEVRANVNFILRVTPYYRALELSQV